MDFETLCRIFFIALVSGVFAVYMIRERLRQRRMLNGPCRILVTTSDVKIDPIALGGTVWVHDGTLKEYWAPSGAEGKLYRGKDERLLPTKGFGEERAFDVLVSADGSLGRSEIRMSEVDAKRLRMVPGAVVTVMFESRRPAKVYHFHEYRPKVPILGVHAPVSMLQPFGPHKVRVPSNVVVKTDDGSSEHRVKKR